MEEVKCWKTADGEYFENESEAKWHELKQPIIECLRSSMRTDDEISEFFHMVKMKPSSLIIYLKEFCNQNGIDYQ